MKSQFRIGLATQRSVHQHAWFVYGRGMYVARVVTQHVVWSPLARGASLHKYMIAEHLHDCAVGGGSREEAG